MAVEELKSTWQNSNPEDFMKTALKQFLNFYLHKVGGLFLVQCNYDKASFPKDIPNFCTKCLTECEIYQEKFVSASSHVLDQKTWNNKFLKIGGRS